MNDIKTYYNVSGTQFSVARYYGGCKINGTYYFYNPVDDTLTREDVIKEQSKNAVTQDTTGF